jgi:hypothetical protein
MREMVPIGIGLLAGLSDAVAAGTVCCDWRRGTDYTTD